jgi:predicted metalloprotease with PDZ domain
LPRKRPSVHYALSWREPNDHLFDITIRFSALRPNPELSLPAWRPGRYLIQNYAANVRQWAAESAGGRPLPIEKTAKSRWRVEAAAGTKIVVRYRFFAGILDAGSSFLDEREAYFNGSNLFMMVVDRRYEPADLSLQVPEGWDVETQLPPAGSSSPPPRRPKRPPLHSDAPAGSELRVARDYDHLIDSPTIIAPDLRTHVFEERGAHIYLIFQNADGIDTRQFVEPARTIVASQAALFGGLPLDEYRFLYHVGAVWHGVEHEASSSIILRRSDLIGVRPGDEGFDNTLAISSHEFFHLWNVKRMMPQAFTPYDYSVETPTRLLWVMEGITSYYGEGTLVRSGLWTRERYLRHLAGEISVLESSPGREHLSLAQASFDGWLQEPAQMHDRANARIDFYNKGEIVGALLDLRIRELTAGRRSLDDVMRALWKRYGKGRSGIPEDGFETAVRKIAGEEIEPFFLKFVNGTDPLPYEELFATAGVSFRRVLAPPEAGLQLSVRTVSERLFVDSVVQGGAAARAGLLPSDEIVALGGMRVTTPSELKAVVRGLTGSTPLDILTARGGQLRVLSIAPAAHRKEEISILVADDATSEQRRRLDEWLGSPS